MENTDNLTCLCSKCKRLVSDEIQTGLVNLVFLGILQVLFQNVVYSQGILFKYSWEESFRDLLAKVT